MYQKIIDWSESLEVRRMYESKLLHHAWETLLVCASEDKEVRRDKVWRLALGMVVLNLPEELAWMICLDWRDFETIGTSMPENKLTAEMYGKLFIQDLIHSIPQSGMAKVLSAYLGSQLSAFPPDSPLENNDGESNGDIRIAPSDEILDEMIVHHHVNSVNCQEGYNLSPECITGGRILASYHLYNKDYESASEVARSSIEALRKLQEDTGILIPAPETGLLVTLATSLIHYQSPKHHPQAQKLFDVILARKSDSVEALVGKGRVALDAGELEEAESYTARALQIDPLNVEAKMEHAWVTVLSHDIENGKLELQETLPLVDGRDLHSRDTIAEIWWRIGKCYWDEGNPPDFESLY